MIPESIEQQQKLAELVKKRAIHLTTIDSFKEALKEMKESLKDEFGRNHGIDLDVLALAYLRDDEKKRKAQEVIDKFDEAAPEAEILSKYINRDSVYDEADKYLG